MHVPITVSYTKERGWEEYLRPRTLTEALECLGRFNGEARVIAGGTDLVVQDRSGALHAKALVDITRIPNLSSVELDKGKIRIGALVTHTEAARSPLIRERATALSEGASRLGSPQIRNIGTVVGNIINAQPGADTTIPLLAFDAAIVVLTGGGEREIPLRDLFTGVGKTVIDSTREVVTEVRFAPARADESSVALRLAKRKGLVLPILTCAAVVSADLATMKFGQVRIALGPVSTTPLRCDDAERLLTGSGITDDNIRKAARAAEDAARPRTSLIRGTTEYRKAMVAVLVERAIREALKRLGGKDA
jgi:CO/xanthine dehydrogenase FAD-binding subunit